MMKGQDRGNEIETTRGEGRKKRIDDDILHPFDLSTRGKGSRRHVGGKEEKRKGGRRRRDFNYRRANSDAPTGQITPVILPSFIAGRERKVGV